MTTQKTWVDLFPDYANRVADGIATAVWPKVTDHAMALPLLRQLARDLGLIPLDLVDPPSPRFPRLEAAAAKLGPNALAVLEEIAERAARDASPRREEAITRQVRELSDQRLDRTRSTNDTIAQLAGKEVFTLSEACTFLRMSHVTLRGLLTKGVIAAGRTDRRGGHWRIRRSALEAFLNGTPKQ